MPYIYIMSNNLKLIAQEVVSKNSLCILENVFWVNLISWNIEYVLTKKNSIGSWVMTLAIGKQSAIINCQSS